MSRRFAVALLALLLLLPSATPAASLDSSGYVGRSCRFQTVAFNVSAGAARQWVPPTFAVLGEDAGTALLVLLTAKCELTPFGGGPNGAVFSEAGIVLVPPEDEPGLHLYLLWHQTDDQAHHALIAGAGVAPAERVDFYFMIYPVSPPWSLYPTANVEVEGAITAYETWIHYVVGRLPPVDTTWVWWHAGTHGTLRIDHTFDYDESQGLFVGRGIMWAEGALGTFVSSGYAHGTLSYGRLTVTIGSAG